MDLGISEKVAPLLERVRSFINEQVMPVEHEFVAEIEVDDPFVLTDRQTEILKSLKTQAREAGLWNFFLTGEEGSGLNTVEYAYLAEEMGKSRLAAEVFNCSAPDTGNMEVLHKYGSEAQKKQWLEPLLAGEIRSCFGMTEPAVASSDATNICTSAILEGDEWVINGEKYYISGAGDPRCKVMITMVKTSPDAAPHRQQSQILVPIDTPGVHILEGMEVFGHDDAPHGHMHIHFDNVRVPKENILLGEGRGFEISQVRLGPGRIHHCMRSIGTAERALELMIRRTTTRTAFGKPIIQLGKNLELVSRARIEIDACRLMVLRAAKAMDVLGNKEARVYVSAIKAMVPEKVCQIIDQAIQMHGATGVSQWTPLAGMYTGQRTLRIADGPDEVHHMVVGRAEVRKYEGERYSALDNVLKIKPE